LQAEIRRLRAALRALLFLSVAAVIAMICWAAGVAAAAYAAGVVALTAVFISARVYLMTKKKER
jgi:membrane protein YdbS with pleckstrin-like domain